MEQNEEKVAIVINSEEALAVLTAEGFELGDDILITNQLKGDHYGSARDKDFDCFEPIDDCIDLGERIGVITQCVLFQDNLYISTDRCYGRFYKIYAFMKINSKIIPSFSFDERIVWVDFKNGIVVTDGGESSSIEDALKLYNCMIAANLRCETEFCDFELELPDAEYLTKEEYEAKKGNIAEDDRIKFGCQSGTFREVKVIIDYIKSQQNEKN